MPGGKARPRTIRRRWRGFARPMYGKGLGVPVDYRRAMAWYRKAAAQGHATAQNNIGFIYLNGQGVPKDLVYADS
jgi:TPR repeat protein